MPNIFMQPVKKATWSNIIQSSSLSGELCLIRPRQVVPTVCNMNQPSGFKCCCLHMASTPRAVKRKKTSKTDSDREGHPRSPSDSACSFLRLLQTLLVGRGWQQAWGIRKLQSLLWFHHIRRCVFVPWGSHCLSLRLGYFVRWLSVCDLWALERLHFQRAWTSAW